MVTYTGVKQLGGKQDLTIGLGTVAQPRKSGIQQIVKLNVSELQGVYTVNTLVEFNSIDPLLLGDIKVVHIIETNQSFKWNGTIWEIHTSGGQFHDIGTTIGKSVPFVADTTGAEVITVLAGTNSFAIDNITVVDGAEIIIEDGAVFKVL